MPREPWIKVKIGVRRSGKLAALPNDTARLGYFYILIEAKVQRLLGAFDNKAHFVEVLGRFSKHFDAYLTVGLLEVAPALCRECKARHRDAKRGQVIVHDYRREQRDPTNADRQADYRATHAEDEEGAEGDADITPPVTDSVTPPVTDQQGATVTPDSRARATTATGTETILSTGRDSSSLVPGAPIERDDVRALLERGWPKVTRAQRRVLDEVLARHDLTGPAFAAAAIRMTPANADPLAAVMDADRRWQAAQRAQADAAELDWNETKAAERNGSGKLGDVLRKAAATEPTGDGPAWMPKP